ncbi:MAG: MoaD/ThiS family protein [Acidobacteriota bacterium]|nr:MoaD/ThiS family protein [Acidobacteriota bacterium]
MTTLLLLGPAREAAGVARDEFVGATIDEILDAAIARYGEAFTRVLAVSQVWLNGDVTTRDAPVGPQDEVVVLPPISGG